MSNPANQTLESLLNQYLNLDPNSEARLAKLEGKTLKLIIKPITLFFIFEKQGIKIKQNLDDAQVDASIEGYPLAFIQLHFSHKAQAPNLFKQDLTISGDIDFGQDVRELFSELDIDWEEYLSKFTGDIIAHSLMNVFKDLTECTEQVSESMQQNLTEYLQEEIKILPNREEVSDFCDEVDALSLKADRLQAKVDLLS